MDCCLNSLDSLTRLDSTRSVTPLKVITIIATVQLVATSQLVASRFESIIANEEKNGQQPNTVSRKRIVKRAKQAIAIDSNANKTSDRST